MAFSNAARVKNVDSGFDCMTRSTIVRPARWAMVRRRASTAGIDALPGNATPSASHRLPTVEAVPIVLQAPALRDMAASALKKSFSLILPARRSSLNRQTSVPDPMVSPRKRPLSIGPEDTTIVGRSTDAAPINWAGVVLSQPPSSTTPSMA